MSSSPPRAWLLRHRLVELGVCTCPVRTVRAIFKRCALASGIFLRLALHCAFASGKRAVTLTSATLSSPPPLPPRRMDALVLLEQWQGEHERNELGLHQYAKQKDLLLRALKDRTIATQDLQEETVAIKKKTVESAGTSALQLQLIDQEEQEGQVLDGEISRLAEEMRLKEAELERRGVETKASVARPEPPKRQSEA